MYGLIYVYRLLYCTAEEDKKKGVLVLTVFLFKAHD